MSIDAITTAMCPACERVVWTDTDNAVKSDGQYYHAQCAADAHEEEVADLTKKLAASERALERMTRTAAGQNDTIRFLRDKLSLHSPSAEDQFAMIAKDLARLDAIEKRVAEIEKDLNSNLWENDEGDETEPAKPDAWRHKRTCGDECECPSKLYHDVKEVLAEFDAPIPRQQTMYYLGKIEGCLNDEDERDGFARGELESVPVVES